jgi:uncharacterized protein YndB with AHSA1/START domain
MDFNLKVSKSIEINSTSSKVWDVLTNPEKIKVYLFGTETITDWEVGSPIIFQGDYQGKKYKDKGVVLENKPNQFLSYSYWSGFSGLEDKPENYFKVTYLLEENSENKILFTWKQEGFKSEDGKNHTEKGLPSMLEEIKKLAEEI